MATKIIFDYSYLRGKITEKCGTQTNFASLIGISRATLSNKLMNKTYFTQDDIALSIDILGLSNDEVCKCFFSA